MDYKDLSEEQKRLVRMARAYFKKNMLSNVMIDARHQYEKARHKIDGIEASMAFQAGFTAGYERAFIVRALLDNKGKTTNYN